MIDKNIEVGRYIVLQYLAMDAPYFSPRNKITRISGQRVYYLDKHGENEEYVLTKSVYAVCDTVEECKMLLDFTKKCLEEVYNLKKQHEKLAKEFFEKE